jgi:hypothetical protein
LTPVAITGVLISKEETLVRGVKRGRYTLETQDGGLFVCMGTTMLDQTMIHATLGETITIDYLGEQPTQSGMKLKMFDVYETITDDLIADDDLEHLTQEDDRPF